MTSDQFCYWLQGLLELQPDLKTLDEKQVRIIREHLHYVFQKGHLTPADPVLPFPWPQTPYPNEYHPPTEVIC